MGYSPWGHKKSKTWLNNIHIDHIEMFVHLCTWIWLFPSPVPSCFEYIYIYTKFGWILFQLSHVGSHKFATPRWQSRRTCSHLLLWELQNYNSLPNNHQQENVGSNQKKIPHMQGQRTSPSKMIGRAKSHLESHPILTRDDWRAQTKCTCTRKPHIAWVRPAYECLSVSCWSTGQQWPDTGAGALGPADLDMA